MSGTRERVNPARLLWSTSDCGGGAKQRDPFNKAKLRWKLKCLWPVPQIYRAARKRGEATVYVHEMYILYILNELTVHIICYVLNATCRLIVRLHLLLLRPWICYSADMSLFVPYSGAAIFRDGHVLYSLEAMIYHILYISSTTYCTTS
jgi:hypothetical protein